MRYSQVFIVVLAVLLVAPVSAGYTITALPVGSQSETFQNVRSFSFDASPDGNRIQMVHIVIPQGCVVNFTLYYGTGATVSGGASYTALSILQSRSEMTFGGSGISYEFIDLHLSNAWDLVGYAKNESTDPVETGFLFYDKTYGITNNLGIFYPVSTISKNTIYRIDITATDDIRVIIQYNTEEVVSDAASKTLVDAVLDYGASIIKYAGDILGSILTGLYWLKFFFIDHIRLTIILYGSVCAAYAANTAHDIFDFFKKFFRLQKAIFEFILFVGSTLWTMLTALK